MSPQRLGLLAGIGAALLWSLKPLYVTALKESMSSSEIFFCAGLISMAASLIGFVCLRRDIAKLYGLGVSLYVLKHALLAGALLSVWYIAFYKALSGTVSAQATIISFTWPLFALIAMRLFAPHLQRPLLVREYPFIGIAFIGAAITASGTSADWELMLYALVAALGSGFYLPFLSLALERVTKSLGSRLKVSFITVSLANVFSFVLATPVLVLADVSIAPSAPIGLTEIAVLCAIGIGTYLSAELIWCWAICTTGSPTIASLPYFSPAVSVILLAFVAGDRVPANAVAGPLLILFSNLALHFDFTRSTKAVA